MPTQINGSTGVSKVQDGVVVQADLAANVAGNGPAFSLYQTSAQTLGAWAKLLMNAEEYDSDGAALSGRFTAPVSGYYQLAAELTVTTQNTISISLYKNGVQARIGDYANAIGVGVSALLFLEAGDYVEAYGFSTGTPSVSAFQNATYFSGFLARAA